MIGIIHIPIKVLKIARIGEFIEIDYETIFMLIQYHPHEITTDKSRASCYKYSHSLSKNSVKGRGHGLMRPGNKACILSQLNLLLNGRWAAVL
jgi:hypothetical protein